MLNSISEKIILALLAGATAVLTMHHNDKKIDNAINNAVNKATVDDEEA